MTEVKYCCNPFFLQFQALSKPTFCWESLHLPCCPTKNGPKSILKGTTTSPTSKPICSRPGASEHLGSCRYYSTKFKLNITEKKVSLYCHHLLRRTTKIFCYNKMLSCSNRTCGCCSKISIVKFLVAATNFYVWSLIF